MDNHSVGNGLRASTENLAQERGSALDRSLPRLVIRPGDARMAGLDGLRAIAIGLVVLLHASMMPGFPQNPLLLGVARIGGFGVTVFFVLSGFLITHLLLAEEKRTGTMSLSRFYLRRAFRILPAAYVYVAGVSIVAALVGASLTAGEVASSMFFVRNLTGGSTLTAHFWSLAIEEQFYLIWPVALWLCPARHRFWLTVLSCLVAPVWRQCNIEAFGAVNINWSRADLRYDALLMGACLAILRGDDLCALARKVIARHSAVVVVGSCVLVASSLSVETLGIPGWLQAATPTFQHFLLAIITLGVVDGESRAVKSVLDWRPLVIVGQLSYSLYLWQQVFLVPWRGNASIDVPIVLAAALLAAIASYLLIEKPTLRLRERVMRAQKMGTDKGV